MKLVYEGTAREVKSGDAVKSFRGEAAKVESIQKPHHGGSTGRVYVSFDGSDSQQGFFPSVFGMEWIDREDQR